LFSFSLADFVLFFFFFIMFLLLNTTDAPDAETREGLLGGCASFNLVSIQRKRIRAFNARHDRGVHATVREERTEVEPRYESVRSSTAFGETQDEREQMGRERRQREESVGTHGVEDAKLRVDAKIRRERVEETLRGVGRGGEGVRRFSSKGGRSVRNGEFEEEVVPRGSAGTFERIERRVDFDDEEVRFDRGEVEANGERRRDWNAMIHQFSTHISRNTILTTNLLPAF
tara:strand:- start:19 stop:708 length:690 start_codon:yes stop_codon:yes gene_type:complete